jgi:hypothetical protein
MHTAYQSKWQGLAAHLLDAFVERVPIPFALDQISDIVLCNIPRNHISRWKLGENSYGISNALTLCIHVNQAKKK